MTVCAECQGVGYKKQLSYYQNVQGTAVLPQLQFPAANSSEVPNTQFQCTRCGGTGIQRSFGV